MDKTSAQYCLQLIDEVESYLRSSTPSEDNSEELSHLTEDIEGEINLHHPHNIGLTYLGLVYYLALLKGHSPYWIDDPQGVLTTEPIVEMQLISLTRAEWIVKIFPFTGNLHIEYLRQKDFDGVVVTFEKDGKIGNFKIPTYGLVVDFYPTGLNTFILDVPSVPTATKGVS